MNRMITDRYSKLISEMGMRSMMRAGDDCGDELEMLLREQQQRRQQEVSDVERELNIYRSGSAPPTVEGSLSGLFGGGIAGLGRAGLSEEEIRSDPSYIKYYYSNVNLNPRLPPPLLSKEDWRFAQRLQGGGGAGSSTASSLAIGDRRKVAGVGVDDGANGDRSLFSVQPEFGGKIEENVMDARKEWGGDGLLGLSGMGLGRRQKSFAEIIQDDPSHGSSVSGHPSHPASRAFDNVLDSSEPQFAHLQQELTSVDSIRSGANGHGISTIQSIGLSASQTYASALGSSLSRSTTPDPQFVAKSPSPRIPPGGGGRVSTLDKRTANALRSSDDVPQDMNVPLDLAAALSGMSLSINSIVDDGKHSASQIHHENIYHMHNDQNPTKHRSLVNKPESMQFHKSAVPSVDSYLKGPSTPALNGGGNSPSHYPSIDSPNSSFSSYALGGAAVNPASPSMLGNQLGGGSMSPLFDNIAAARAVGVDSRAVGGGLTLGPNLLAAAAELQNLNRIGNQNSGSDIQMSMMDPVYLQYLRSIEYAAALNNPQLDRESLGNSYMGILELQKSYLESLLLHQKSQYGLPYPGKPGSLNHGYYGNPGFGLGMSYPGSPLVGPMLSNSPIGSGSPVRHGERNMRFPSGGRSLANVMGTWHLEHGTGLEENFASSLLDQFKSNKTKCFELSEIGGHVVEFSADQYGSRFIQQKLETATTEEKNMVFHEIMPQALSLMTDVFGNYVIQKFFEHGSPSQIRELADQLTGHVLALSLQMYGCRVIQKAIEVVDLDQQTKMVAELDGHVMRCVRDQNGNHVIQKCIECIPENAIQFIVCTFYDQVVTLSTHPYGCRVIQRVLEHCHDAKTQSIVMDEILQSVCMLAQDQYGNYVVQHVLEHGKPEERTAIINKLIGQIVQMSQQKFASNVVEKCLTFGTPEERQTLVDEMLGSTDENEPLQVMMKDQFANYVVQKVLETCDDQQLELILNRIKVHLNALKKYTYGKHIVARVEKLVAAGERRIGILSSYSA